MKETWRNFRSDTSLFSKEGCEDASIKNPIARRAVPAVGTLIASCVWGVIMVIAYLAALILKPVIIWAGRFRDGDKKSN